MFIFFCWNRGSHACTSTFIKGAVFKAPQHFFFQIYFHLWMEFHVWMFFLHLCMCTIYAWYYRDRKRGYWISGHWNYRWFWAAMCVLETESGCSTRAAIDLNLWVISPVPFSPTPPDILNWKWYIYIYTHTMFPSAVESREGAVLIHEMGQTAPVGC